MRRKIIWSFWNNPFSDDEYLKEDEVQSKTPWEQEEENKEFQLRPVIPTLMGFMPIQPFQSLTKYFEFWVGNTNFDITGEVKEVIESTPGVEILDIFSRYCFRIAIGKAFKSTDVKISIQEALNVMPPKKGEINPRGMKLDEDTNCKVLELKAVLKEQFPFWAIYILPNGEIDGAGSNTLDGYEMHLDLYQYAQELAGGVIHQYA